MYFYMFITTINGYYSLGKNLYLYVGGVIYLLFKLLFPEFSSVVMLKW